MKIFVVSSVEPVPCGSAVALTERRAVRITSMFMKFLVGKLETRTNSSSGHSANCLVEGPGRLTALPSGAQCSPKRESSHGYDRWGKHLYTPQRATQSSVCSKQPQVRLLGSRAKICPLPQPKGIQLAEDRALIQAQAWRQALSISTSA